MEQSHAKITLGLEQIQRRTDEAVHVAKKSDSKYGKGKRSRSSNLTSGHITLPVGVVGRLDVLGRDDVERQHRISSTVVHLSLVSDAA